MNEVQTGAGGILIALAIRTNAGDNECYTFCLAIVLMLAWKVAGWYGLDRFLLPLVGTPWTWRSEQTKTKPPITPQPPTA